MTRNSDDNLVALAIVAFASTDIKAVPRRSLFCRLLNHVLKAGLRTPMVLRNVTCLVQDHKLVIRGAATEGTFMVVFNDGGLEDLEDITVYGRGAKEMPEFTAHSTVAHILGTVELVRSVVDGVDAEDYGDVAGWLVSARRSAYVLLQTGIQLSAADTMPPTQVEDLRAWVLEAIDRAVEDHGALDAFLGLALCVLREVDYRSGWMCNPVYDEIVDAFSRACGVEGVLAGPLGKYPETIFTQLPGRLSTSVFSDPNSIQEVE